MTYRLAIGDRMYSSWSLRGWLLFARFGIPVKTATARMYQPEFRKLVAEFAPTRTVPALEITDDTDRHIVWDSLAIAETLAERHPEARLWPADAGDRMLARALAAEMHSGFTALRGDCPMNLRQMYRDFAPSDAVVADLQRLAEIWDHARARKSGPGKWLLGAYSVADVMFAPVAARIAGYGLPVTGYAAEYVAAHLAVPAFRQWRAMAFANDYVQAAYEFDLPRAPWPGPATLPAEAVVDKTPINDACPYSGKPVAPDSLARIDGQIVGFCNRFCRDKSVADALAWPKLAALLGH